MTKKRIQKNEQIYELTTLVAGKFSLQQVLDKLAQAAVRITDVKACSIRLLDEETNELKMRSTYGLSDEYRNKGVVSKNDAVIKAAFDGQAVVLDDMQRDERVKYRAAAAKEGLRGQLTVAMQFRDKAIGVLRLYNPASGNFGEEDIAFGRAVASQCAVAITNARLYSEAIEGRRVADQIRLGGIIQRRMIPEAAPRINGLDIAAAYIPCFDVGGDFYDFFKIDQECIAVAIADVIGKGVPAAIMMSMFRGAVRAYADSKLNRAGVAEMIDKLNKMACSQCDDSEFITLFYAVIDAKQPSITYCNCGHEPTMLLRNGQIAELKTGGIVLGVGREAEYEIETRKLQDGDFLLFYTDGLIDAADFEGEFWGRKRLMKCLKECPAGSCASIVDYILGHRRRFTGLAKQIDDTSLIAVRVDKKREA
ncbi:PP2C family protein-serine/threonine phosphatase [Planctomycetota bacterium]